MSEVQAPAQPARDGPVGIGGWLILPLIGLVLTPIKGVGFLAQHAGMSFAHLNGAQIALVYAELIGNFVLLIVLPIMMLVLLFKKRRTFPGLFVKWAFAGLAFTLLDLIFGYAFFKDAYEASDTEFMDAATWREVARSIFAVVVWVPYMLNSRRVANTFVE